MKDERPAHLFEVFGPIGSGPAARSCAWPGCGLSGEHRAPVSRERIAEYHWFCLDHVRIYNRSWNYYVGMSDAEMEAQIRADTTWNRPTWRLGDAPSGHGGGSMGSGPTGESQWFHSLNDPFGVLHGHVHGQAAPKPQALTAAERRALDVLDLDFPVTFEAAKAQYKALVKRHHPDANNGAKEAEERLKRINEAFDTIKNGHEKGLFA